MLKSAEHNVHLAWFSPFLDGFMKSQLREYSSLKVCFLLFLDAITLINCIKYPGKSASKLPERTTSVKFRSHAITTGTPNAFRRRVLIGCYRLLNAETTNHAQPLIERVPKSHGGLVLTPFSRSDFVISLFRSRFDFIIFFFYPVLLKSVFLWKNTYARILH